MKSLHWRLTADLLFTIYGGWLIFRALNSPAADHLRLTLGVVVLIAAAWTFIRHYRQRPAQPR